jgi:hypothetical protein
LSGGVCCLYHGLSNAHAGILKSLTNNQLQMCL